MTNPGGKSGDATMSNFWIFTALFGAPLVVVIWAVVSHAIDESRHKHAIDEDRTKTQYVSHSKTTDSSDLYLKYESYNHYEDGEYRG